MCTAGGFFEHTAFLIRLFSALFPFTVLTFSIQITVEFSGMFLTIIDLALVKGKRASIYTEGTQINRFSKQKNKQNLTFLCGNYI